MKIWQWYRSFCSGYGWVCLLWWWWWRWSYNIWINARTTASAILLPSRNVEKLTLINHWRKIRINVYGAQKEGIYPIIVYGKIFLRTFQTIFRAVLNSWLFFIRSINLDWILVNIRNMLSNMFWQDMLLVVEYVLAISHPQHKQTNKTNHKTWLREPRQSFCYFAAVTASNLLIVAKAKHRLTHRESSDN